MGVDPSNATTYSVLSRWSAAASDGSSKGVLPGFCVRKLILPLDTLLRSDALLAFYQANKDFTGILSLLLPAWKPAQAAFCPVEQLPPDYFFLKHSL